MLSENEKLDKFKHLLEYFVSHLEWIVNKDQSHVGYATYIQPLESSHTFVQSGKGQKANFKIQRQIKQWEDLGENNNVAINISQS